MSDHDETPETIDPETTAHDETDDATEDFDAFWSGRDRKRPRLRIMGELIELPPSLPLQFELEARRLQKSKRDKDVRKLVSILFGGDVMERWAEAGMDLEQFQVLLAWAPRRIAGQSVTLASVAAEIAEANAKDEDEPDPT